MWKRKKRGHSIQKIVILAGWFPNPRFLGFGGFPSFFSFPSGTPINPSQTFLRTTDRVQTNLSHRATLSRLYFRTFPILVPSFLKILGIWQEEIRDNPCFLGLSSLPSSKKNQAKEDQGLASSHAGGRHFWRCSGSLKWLELQSLGDPSRTLEGNSRKRSESSPISFIFSRKRCKNRSSTQGPWSCILPRPGRARIPNSRNRGPEIPKRSFPFALERGVSSRKSHFSTRAETPFSMSLVAPPKGPFCTKNSTAPDSVVFCYRRSFLLSVPFSCLFFLEKQALLSALRLRSVLLLP